MFNGLNINGSALTAHKTFLDAVSNNIANMNTAAAPGEETYKRQEVVFGSFRDKLNKELGVKVNKITDADREDRLVYDADNPYADENGYVRYADINLTEEMSDMIVAQRGYQMNLSALNTMKEIYETALSIGK